MIPIRKDGFDNSSFNVFFENPFICFNSYFELTHGSTTHFPSMLEVPTTHGSSVNLVTFVMNVKVDVVIIRHMVPDLGANPTA